MIMSRRRTSGQAAVVIFAISILSVATFPNSGIAAAQPSPELTHPGTTNPQATGTQPGATAKNAVGKESKDRKESSSTVEDIVHLTKAAKDLIEGVLGAISWTVAALAIVVFFRRPLQRLLETLIQTMEERAVTFDLGAVKVQVAERSVDPSEDKAIPLFSQSPFEIEKDPDPDRSPLLADIPPELEFSASDFASRVWSKVDGGRAAATMRKARDALETACRNAHAFEDVEPTLATFVHELEKTRFLEAALFSDLLGQHKFLREGIEQIQFKALAPTEYSFLILHCAGEAYAQKSDWAKGKSVLERITWKSSTPYYLPAGSTWLVCSYHDHILQSQKSNFQLDLDTPEFLTGVNALIEKGEHIYASMKNDPWTSFPSSRENVGYFKRELLKVIGNIASSLGEYTKTFSHQFDYFSHAGPALIACTSTIDGELPSSLDHNNLADFYRQTGNYTKAHEEIDSAIRESHEPDPAFFHTRAMIFWQQREPLKALGALEQFGEAEAHQANGQDVEQYVENQLLAARLAVAVDPVNNARYLALAAGILERVDRFVQDPRIPIDKETANRLQVDIEELLGFAYLQLPGRDSDAIEAFDRLDALGGPKAPDEFVWRRRLGRAKALTHLARSQRRNFSSQVAAEQRKRAYTALVASAAMVKPFALEIGVPVARRHRHFRIRLDTVIAVQALAEESFLEVELKTASDLLIQEGDILISLRTAIDSDSVLQQSFGEDLGTIHSQIRLHEARRCFLLGRILMRSDPSFGDVGLIEKVEDNFKAARGINQDLECRIDLEFGEMLLAAALAGKGDADSLYRRAVASLELATTRDAPALRATTIRALADAYARRNTFLRIGKKSARSTQVTK